MQPFFTIGRCKFVDTLKRKVRHKVFFYGVEIFGIVNRARLFILLTFYLLAIFKQAKVFFVGVDDCFLLIIV
jgi:hypothetical protein